MLTLVFATNNFYKIREITHLINDKLGLSASPRMINILDLDDIGCTQDLPETSDTIEGNASQKAFYVYNNFGYNCFADDTGLEVDALNGRPGVHSARYAGEEKQFDRNILKVLEELKNHSLRTARFRTVISLVINGEERCFEGVVNGRILTSPRGSVGFGYDPVFQPDGYDRTFAEMTMEEKNAISHRAIAMWKMIEYLRGLTVDRQ